MTSSQVKQLRLHPIGKPAHLLQVRSIGLLKGVITPNGAITLTGGFSVKAFILGEKIPGLVQELLKNGETKAMFTVYPRTKDGFVTSFEVIGVWKPSILDHDNSEAQDDLPEEFSIRGEVCRKVWWDAKYGPRVSVQVFGEHFVTVDFDPTLVRLYPGDFVSIDAILKDGRLYAETIQKVETGVFARPIRPKQRPGRLTRQRSSATA